MKQVSKRGAALSLLLGALAIPSLSIAQTNELVVGAPNSTTGGFGEGGRQVIAGLEIAFKEINEAGGIKALNGAKIKLVSGDTSSDNPSQATSVTRRIITQDGAVVLVGAHTSTMTLSAQIEAEKAEVPIITTSYADQIVERGYKYTFKIPPNSTVMAKQGAEYLRELYRQEKKKDLKRVAIFYGTDAASQAAGKVSSALAKEAGQEVVASGSFPSNISDPTPIIAPILSSKPEAIYLNGFTSDIILVTRALRSVGVNIPILGSGSGISVKSIPESLGPAANGILGTVFWNWDLPIEGVKSFHETYSKTYPNEPYPPQEAGEGYAIGYIIKSAVEKAASKDPKKIRDALSSLNEKTLLPGRQISFTPEGLNASALSILVGWNDGKLRTLWPKEYQTTPAVLP
jgi:branched-chain amino acid transport system substrate-binding protein